MKKSKLLMCLTILGFVVLLSSSVLAIWISTHQATTGFEISSSDDIFFSDDFEMTILNTTLELDFIKNETLTIINDDGTRTFGYNISTIIYDVDDDCDNAGDFEINYNYLGNDLGTDGTIEIPEGTSYIYVGSMVKAFSCPSNISSEINLFN